MSIRSPSDDKVKAFGHSPGETKTRAFGHGDSCQVRAPVGVRARWRQKAAARAHVGLKPMRFVSLHHHSTYSYLDGYQLPEAHVRRATEIQMQAIAMTEHGNTSSHVKLEMACEKTGVKPIYGCELYCGPTDVDHRRQSKNHLTVLAATDEGYRNLLRLVTLGWAEGFYYEPTVNGHMLRAHKEGLIILSGCSGSLLFTSLVGGKNIDPYAASYKRGRDVARRFKAAFGDAYYLEVQAFPELEHVCRANKMIARIGEELGIPLVATVDCHYTVPEEAELQQILHNVRGGTRQTLEEQARAWGYDVPLCPPMRDIHIIRRLEGTGLTRQQAMAAVLTTEEVAARCNVQLPKLPMVRYPLPAGRTAVEEWRAWLREGWRYRGCHRLPAAERARYKAQLAKEMAVIEDKDFCDYFLIVADGLRWAKDHGIFVGPARGSAAASLACWLLRITEVNPMQWPMLVFERFIDVSRADLPDIDIDIESERRHELRDYYARKYGADCVNNIGTFTGYKGKNSLDDVARVYRVPKYEVDALKGYLIERSSGDLRASATIEDTVEKFDGAAAVVERHPDLMRAMDLEGNYKGFGVHAAGLVISNGPLTDVAAVYTREVKGQVVQVASMDKYDAERQGLLKIDFLGLNTMSLLATACRMLGMTPEDLYALPLDDQKVFDAFRRNDVVGIFQFDGRATRAVNGALRPDTLEELADINALSRPGPLHSGSAGEYIDAKHGRKEELRLHPVYDAIAGSTKGQIVYQEQILRVVREVGAFDWTAASYIRKIISRKIGEQEFNRQWGRFWDGARAQGFTEEMARRIWGMCITAGAYAFNAAHSVSYSLIGYLCMWVKVHHPAVFYSAALAHMAAKKHTELLRDAARHGLRVLPPHPRRSKASWAPAYGGRAIRAGYNQLPQVGPKMTALIMEAKEQGRVKSWRDLLALRGIGTKTVERFEAFCKADDPFDVYRLDRRLAEVRVAIRRLPMPQPTHTSYEIPYEAGRDEEVVWLGAVKERNLRDIFESHMAKTGEELDPATVRDPHLNELVVMLCEDGGELVSVRFNRWTYPRFKDAIWGIDPSKDVVLVRGVKPGYRAAREIQASQMWVISPNDPEEDDDDAA